jgi:ketosteroid isomerase-like protein
VIGAFRALSDHDLARFMKPWREDGVLVFPGEIWASGRFAGNTA